MIRSERFFDLNYFRYTGTSGGFTFPFEIRNHQVLLTQSGDKYDIRVDNVSFSQQWE